jgi:hypothetical protein
MRLLVDTNLFIEVLLNQVSAGEARTFLEDRGGKVSGSFFHPQASIRSPAHIGPRNDPRRAEVFP